MTAGRLLRLPHLGYCGLVLAGIALGGCSFFGGSKDPFAGKGSPRYSKSGPIPKGGGRYHVGKPYQVAGRTFYPREQPGYDRTGRASWYGPRFHRRKTANGEWFDMNSLTAAHATLPLPSYARVTNLENGREVVVRINDRGPFVADRILDVSRRTAEVLDFKRQGTTRVRVRWLARAPLGDDTRRLAALNAAVKNGASDRQLASLAGNSSPTVRQTRLAMATPHTLAKADAGAVPTPAGAYYVQVAAFANPDNANAARRRLAAIGRVDIDTVSRGLGTIYRVRIGPLASATAARETLNRVVDAGHADALVTTR